jgi:hypothetical protein
VVVQNGKFIRTRTHSLEKIIERRRNRHVSPHRKQQVYRYKNSVHYITLHPIQTFTVTMPPSCIESTEVSDFTVPDHFLCPLTLEPMKNPLASKYGHNFERSAILDWLSTKETCPITRQPLTVSKLIPNNMLRLKIKAWETANEVDLLFLEEEDEEEESNAFGQQQSQESILQSQSRVKSMKVAALANEDEIAIIRKQAEADAEAEEAAAAAKKAVSANSDTRRTHTVASSASSVGHPMRRA